MPFVGKSYKPTLKELINDREAVAKTLLKSSTLPRGFVSQMRNKLRTGDLVFLLPGDRQKLNLIVDKFSLMINEAIAKSEKSDKKPTIVKRAKNIKRIRKKRMLQK